MNAEKVDMVTEVINDTLRDLLKPWNKPFRWVETRAGVSRYKQLLIMVIGVSFLLLFVWVKTAMVISNVIGFAFPAYMTIALMMLPRKPESYAKSSAVAINKWLVYWPAFVAIMIVEQHLGFILRFVPFYLLFKTLFLVWCTAPFKNGVAIQHTKQSPHLEKYYD
ncbi:TB2/DP1/HVA22-related protein [Cinara cedri]|uniref:Receptor expression-enhancing protein n=1 Tax=Cinara cedri TaxID=506608 RepID=A0A5E4MCP7_9HEMI|nr:TB2/DP1/HVA22-related protein [Cinara cedri]